MANTVRNTRTELLYAECGATLKNFYLSKLLCFCSSLFEKNRNNAKYSIYRNRLPVFRDGHLLQGGGGGVGLVQMGWVGVIPFCAPENGGLHKIVQPFRLNLTRYLCSEFNGHDWLQTCRYKIREFWGLFAKIREKSVVEFPSYWHFLYKSAVLIICRYIKS